MNSKLQRLKFFPHTLLTGKYVKFILAYEAQTDTQHQTSQMLQ